VAGFDVAVLASLHEGLPNTVLEAMAAGVPVVATAVGGVTEIIEDGKTGYLVRPANPDAMAERLKYMLEHGRLRQEIALRGQRSVRDRFGIEYMVKSVQDLYEAMLNEKNIGMRKIEPKL
jgi:glycosyltransferase involved in cell wall biosynthesis